MSVDKIKGLMNHHASLAIVREITYKLSLAFDGAPNNALEKISGGAIAKRFYIFSDIFWLRRIN